MNLKPETKALIDKANELLAIWQEQEKTSERAWEEQREARRVFTALVEGEGSTSAEEIRAAYARWTKLLDCAQDLPDCFEAQREWTLIRNKAQRALMTDAGLLRSEEEEIYEREEEEEESRHVIRRKKKGRRHA